MMDVGGFFVEFEPFRSASGPSSRRGEYAVAAMASRATPSTPPTRRSRDLISTQAHWQQLEELTGVSIGDVKTITLGKIFSMELGQYGEDVDEIVICADSASFLPVSELQVIIRASTRLQRQFRNDEDATQARSTN